jgi:hypothetical protein
MAVQKSVRKEVTQEEIFAAFIANESSRKTRKQLIRDVIHDLIVVRYDQAIRKGKIGRAAIIVCRRRPCVAHVSRLQTKAIKKGKGSSTTAQTRKGREREESRIIINAYPTHDDVTALEFCCCRRKNKKRGKERARCSDRGLSGYPIRFE